MYPHKKRLRCEGVAVSTYLYVYIYYSNIPFIVVVKYDLDMSEVLVVLSFDSPQRTRAADKQTSGEII